MIKILQWNAQSLSEADATELQQLAIDLDADLILISELGHRRKIPQYTKYTAQDVHTQSAIFWHATDTATKEITPRELAIYKDTRITTQIIEMKNQLIVIHPYIPPDEGRANRKEYWNALDKWTTTYQNQKQDPLPITILGDLNTRDTRFGLNHTEHHAYLDPILNDEKTETNNWHTLHNITEITHSKGNTLDNCLGNTLFTTKLKHWEALDELDSDHKPTFTTTKIKRAADNKSHKRNPTITKIDQKASANKLIRLARELREQCENEGRKPTLQEVHDISKKSILTKKVKAEATTWWNPTIQKAMRKRQACKRRLNKEKEKSKPNETKQKELHDKWKEARKKLRALITNAKKERLKEKALEAAQDRTGAKAWKLLKELEPKTNKKAKKWTTHTINALDQAENIAKTFAKISSNEDIEEMTDDEKKELDETIAECERIVKEQPPTTRDGKRTTKSPQKSQQEIC